MKGSHIAWNLTGLALPLAVAALTVPVLIHTLGQEKFGLLALSWALIGYAGALDLGMGRALTQLVSKLLGENKLVEIPDVLTTTARITLITGVIGGLLIAIFLLLGGYKLIRVSSTPPQEIIAASLLLAVALPVQAMSATYRGLNEAFMNFKEINLLRVFLGVVNFAGPCAISLASDHLALLVSSMLLSRLLAFFIFRRLAYGCLQQAVANFEPGKYSPMVAKYLFGFGGWVTVSSIISPILVHADRFVIGASISAAAVSTYVLPYEIVVQTLIIVGAISSVMFPALSRIMHERPNQWRSYFEKWLLRVGLLMSIICSFLALLFPLILNLWLGNQLKQESIVVGQILCIGVFANSLGNMLFAVLHAQGRADFTAKLHLLEFPVFIILLSVLISKFGLYGAAWAWVIRMVFDTCGLFLLYAKLVNRSISKF